MVSGNNVIGRLLSSAHSTIGGRQAAVVNATRILRVTSRRATHNSSLLRKTLPVCRVNASIFETIPPPLKTVTNPSITGDKEKTRAMGFNTNINGSPHAYIPSRRGKSGAWCRGLSKRPSPTGEAMGGGSRGFRCINQTFNPVGDALVESRRFKIQAPLFQTPVSPPVPLRAPQLRVRLLPGASKTSRRRPGHHNRCWKAFAKIPARRFRP